MPQPFTPDGTRLLVFENFKDLSMLNLARPDRLEPLLHSEFVARLGVVSPDGNWIAYESNESGDRFEIFVRPFPNVSGQREKVSLHGGRFPGWGPKGSGELFYVDLNGGGDGSFGEAVTESQPRARDETVRLGKTTLRSVGQAV